MASALEGDDVNLPSWETPERAAQLFQLCLSLPVRDVSGQTLSQVGVSVVN